ncbi:MAG: hypothetical protein QOJ98_1791, partial [Acidobacteriota bacterium]|nr:hypothetical protein [Acidobacteriota bacterium]
MGKVFISYVTEDVTFARYLAEALRAAHFDPWLDEERLAVGGDLEKKLA